MQRWCLMILGWLALVTHIFGIVLPLLLSHPWFGTPITDWQQYRGIRRHARRCAIIFILFTFSVSLAVLPLLWVRG